MGRYYTEVDTTVEVDVDIQDVLEEASIEELEEELMRRENTANGYYNQDRSLETMYYKFLKGENIDHELRELFFERLGRIA